MTKSVLAYGNHQLECVVRVFVATGCVGLLHGSSIPLSISQAILDWTLRGKLSQSISFTVSCRPFIGDSLLCAILTSVASRQLTNLLLTGGVDQGFERRLILAPQMLLAAGLTCALLFLFNANASSIYWACK